MDLSNDQREALWASAEKRMQTPAVDVERALYEALSELVDGIEDGGGHDGNGDVFDIAKACAAIALYEAKGKL